jgi:hypothetical protein
MGKLSFLTKRTLVLCAFLFCGCSEQTQNTQDSTSTHKNVSAKATNTNIESDNLPLLSLSELLNASDVKQALAEAAANNDQETLLMWQENLLDAADEVNVLSKERKLISGAQGLQYLKYQGMKTNYQAAFKRAFIDFEDVDKVYSEYPAFINLHKRSSELVKQRDDLVAKVTEELEANGFEGNAFEEAKRQWRNFVLAESVLD